MTILDRINVTIEKVWATRYKNYNRSRKKIFQWTLHGRNKKMMFVKIMEGSSVALMKIRNTGKYRAEVR